MRKETPTKVKRIQATQATCPPNAIWVGSGSRWDTPFPISLSLKAHWATPLYEKTLKLALGRKSKGLHLPNKDRFDWIAEHLSELQGKDLACECPIEVACHANILVKYANSKKEKK